MRAYIFGASISGVVQTRVQSLPTNNGKEGTKAGTFPLEHLLPDLGLASLM